MTSSLTVNEDTCRDVMSRIFALMADSLTVRLVIAAARAFACALLEMLTFE